MILNMLAPIIIIIITKTYFKRLLQMEVYSMDTEELISTRNSLVTGNEFAKLNHGFIIISYLNIILSMHLLFRPIS